MNTEVIIMFILLLIVLILMITINESLLIYSGNYYKCNIRMKSKFIKVSDETVVPGYERLYLIPYQNKHFIMTSKGKILGIKLNSDKEELIIGGIPIIIENGVFGKYNLVDNTKQKISQSMITDPLLDIEVHLLLPISPVKVLKNILDTSIKSLK